MTETSVETVTCYQVALSKPADRIQHGLVYRSSDVAQRKADELGSSVSTIEVFAEIAAELPE